MTKNLIRIVCLMLDVAVKTGKKGSGYFPLPHYLPSTKDNLELKKPWAVHSRQSWHNETEQPSVSHCDLDEEKTKIRTSDLSGLMLAPRAVRALG